MIALVTSGGSGCGDRLQDGEFLGDATLRLHGALGAVVGNPAHATVGAVWLGYSGLVDPSADTDTTVLPITSVEFPPGFECDILSPPPSAGAYATPAGVIIPASIRIARLVLLDDDDGDGHFALDANRRVVSPDRLLARSDSFALLFVEKPPTKPGSLAGLDAFLTDWAEVRPGYDLVALDPSVPSPDLRGQIVNDDTAVIFAASGDGTAF